MTLAQNIQVSVRCRPLALGEVKSDLGILSNLREIRLLDRNAVKNFLFDHVFDEQDPQAEIFDLVVRPLIGQVLLGFNCTVFAYGQTGTGKTYTMEGEWSDSSSYNWENDPCSGMIPRAIGQIFERLKKEQNPFTIRVSFIELYNEDIYDLLSPIHDITKLKVFEDGNKKGSVIVNNLEEVNVTTKEELFDILKRGSAKRQTASTLLNACSSRSHTIFSITVCEEGAKFGKLNLVDLAGSENIGRSGAQDKRAREAGSINQSLLTLGRVITALVEKRPHVPYRESKLTRLLQDSLGGKTKTSMIATISPSIDDLEDTLSTLEYASRARNIINVPESNQNGEMTEYQVLVARHSQEINELEFKVRNEVAVEFRREIEKMKQSFELNKLEQRNQFQAQLKEEEERVELLKAKLEQTTNEKKELEKRLENYDPQEFELLKLRLKEAVEDNQEVELLNSKLNEAIEEKALLERQLEGYDPQKVELLERQLKESVEKEVQLEKKLKATVEMEKELGDLDRLQEELTRVQKELKITEHLAEQRADHNQSLEEELRRAKLELKSLREEIVALEEQLAANPVAKKAKVRQRPLLEEATCDYANMTFDGGDEITQASGKKTRKKIVNCGRNKELVLSGKKQKIRKDYDETEVSPIPAAKRAPTRMTRAARRKLDFENDL